MTKSVLLTRSKLFNSEIMKSLEKYDYEFLECDLIKYKLQPFDVSELIGFQNIIITSYFAATQVPPCCAEPHSMLTEIPDQVRNDSSMNAWVVGSKSAKVLKSKGYNIQFCANSAEELKQNIPKDIYKDTIYLSSDHITVNMPSLITRKIFYKVKYKESLSKAQLLRYKKGIDYILLYSTNCAKILLKLLLENDLMNSIENTMVIVISSNVEKIVRPYFQNIKICKGSDLMLDYLEKQ